MFQAIFNQLGLLEILQKSSEKLPAEKKILDVLQKVEIYSTINFNLTNFIIMIIANFFLFH